VKYNFFMSLRTQYENLGDYLIAQATIDILSDIGDLTLDIKNVPEKYLKLFCFPENVKLVKKSFLSTIIWNRNKKWIYVIKPGGYETNNTIKSKFKLSLIFFYFFISKVLFNAKLMKMPHSYLGKLTFIDRIYQDLFDLNIVRDKISLNNYRNKTVVLEDLATYYFNKESKFRSQFSTEKNNITISLRYDRLNDEEKISFKLAKFLLNTENLNEIYYVSQVTFDKELNKNIAFINQKKHISYDITNTSLTEITEIYNSSKYVISNRLHVLLLGKINGAIPIAIIDTKKDKKIIGSLDILNIKWIDKDKLNNILEEKKSFCFFENDLNCTNKNILQTIKDLIRGLNF